MLKKIQIEKSEAIWRDRKRWCGMPLSFTQYELFEDCLVLKAGFFSTLTDEVMLYRIMDLRLLRRLGQKIFGVGTVILICEDKSHPTMELKNIKQPEAVWKLLGREIERQRVKRGIASREFLGGFGENHCGCDHDFETLQ